MKKIGLWLVIIFASFTGQAQTTITFIPQWNTQFLHLNKFYKSVNNVDSVNITAFKFYISNIQFCQNNQVIYSTSTPAYLIDFEDKCAIQFPVTASSFNTIKFTLGIDSSTNMAGALGQDLDPIHGMYWAWQSGYINFKIEGTSPVCKSRNNVFQYHVGGYLQPNQTVQHVILKTAKGPNIKIGINMAIFLNSVDLAANPEVMSPSPKAVKLAQLFKTIFSTLP